MDELVDNFPPAIMRAHKISSLVTEISVDSSHINPMAGFSCICLSKSFSITFDKMVRHSSSTLCELYFALPLVFTSKVITAEI